MRLPVLLLVSAALATGAVPIILPPSPHPVEQLAASELAAYLAKLYPTESFPIAVQAPSGRHIAFTRAPGTPESFTVSHTASTGTIAAAGPRGALFAVYALLEKLGCGFFLSSQTLPPPSPGPLSFDAWSLHDAPLYQDRIVFNWHNFLSSASTWELADWQRYIDNSLRMRFNTVMVHAYGNNPIFTFTFNGIAKPVGHLATTAAGRDWGTQHVNDVRLLTGGEIFSDLVFGASIAKVPGPERAAAAQRLMQQVFAHAAGRGMNVTFALDVDTESANDQAMIATLPASARITRGRYQLANPDTPEGYAFYKAQAAQLLALYPQINRLAVWFRPANTPWASITLDEFPPAWKSQFHGDPAHAFVFAIGRITAAFARALAETGHPQVELAAGTWRFELNQAADRYLPANVTYMPLDWSTTFDTAPGQRLMRNLSSGRKVIPIIWAHHDDRTYIGRPYTPYVNLSRLLDSTRAQGFGIIHWTTRPLDLYFKSSILQSWLDTRDQPLEQTCDQTAARTFGPSTLPASSEYLFAFLTEAPQFGRETTDRFMDIPLADPQLHIRRARARLALLNTIATASPALDYFRHYETFILDFFEAHTAYERAQAALKAGNQVVARTEITAARPEAAIASYVRAARSGQITAGERALVVSLNLRWLPYFASLRQAVGLEPVRILIGPVQTEPLAQGAGTHTFHIDAQARLWRVLQPTTATLQLNTILDDPLAPGLYSINGEPARPAQNGRLAVPVTPNLREIVITKAP